MYFMRINEFPIFKINRNIYNNQNTTTYFGVTCPNLAALKQDTVSFKGNVLKKSDFKGSDLAVIERYKPNIQQFKKKEDLQTFAESKINELKEKDFGGRQEETKIQRKAMLKEWFDYVIKENDAYSNTQRLIILSAITKDLKSNNDNIPDVLNKGVLAQTVTDLEVRLKSNPKDNFDFHKMYKNNLRVSIMEDSSTSETMTGWVVIPSKENDPKNFEKNVEKLKTLSHNSWCTKSYNAEPYLSEGDFHVYLENGQPKLGVRFNGQKVHEIQGEKNNGRIPIKYLETFKEHEKEYNMQLGYNAKNEVRNAEAVKVESQKVKQELGSAIELKNIDDAIKIFDYVGIKVEKKEDKLVISEYRQPDKSNRFNFEDLGIDENNLLQYVTKINGRADFRYSNITDFGQLQGIGGYVEVNDKKLFKKLFDKLDLLEGVNLHELKKAIKAKDTEKILNSIGIKTEKDVFGKLTISEYKHPFKSLSFSDLGINENDLFKDIKAIEGDINLSAFRITKLGALQRIGGNADFRASDVKNLGKLQTIGGNAEFAYTWIKSLGNLKSIGGNAVFFDSEIACLGDLQSIGGDVDFECCCKLKTLGKLQSIGGKANFRYTFFTNLGNLQSIGGDANFSDSQITNLGKLKSIGGNARLFRCKLNEKDFDNIIVEKGVQDDDAQASKKEQSKPPQQLEQPQSVCIEKHTFWSRIISLFKNVF